MNNSLGLRRILRLTKDQYSVTLAATRRARVGGSTCIPGLDIDMNFMWDQFPV
jgi:hypothetical protein